MTKEDESTSFIGTMYDGNHASGAGVNEACRSKESAHKNHRSNLERVERTAMPIIKSAAAATSKPSGAIAGCGLKTNKKIQSSRSSKTRRDSPA